VGDPYTKTGVRAAGRSTDLVGRPSLIVQPDEHPDQSTAQHKHGRYHEQRLDVIRQERHEVQGGHDDNDDGRGFDQGIARRLVVKRQDDGFPECLCRKQAAARAAAFAARRVGFSAGAAENDVGAC
jgi:hypothetical protein